MRQYTDTDKLRIGRKYAPGSRCLVAFFFLIVLPGMLPQQEYTLSQSREETPYTISVSVEMVVLNATVRDGKGSLVSGLVKEDFQVNEDGIPQQIECFSCEDIPVTVGLVIDNSGTMGPKRSEVITSALVFARSSNPEDQMFVVHFNENVSFGLPKDMPFTDKIDQLEIALSGITADGMTALYDAVAAALDHLKKGNRDKKVLIVISDGEDNASKINMDQILVMAGKSDAIIYTIGIFDENNPDRNLRALRKLARATGGEAFLPASAKQVVPICRRIAYDIRNQYAIAYQPTNKKQDGSFRAIQVTAKAKDGRRLSVRTRAGYHAPLKSPPLPMSEQPHEDPN
ncbi:MAG: VWA domain-containing protein [Acidobacteria bacterium]|nr:VWA domain-containing protein [Acidobacteriota bacterium]